MTTQPRHVLVTGGSRGIGLGLALRYVAAGADVTVTGRSADQLAEIERVHDGIGTVVNDLSTPAGREDLAAWVAAELPHLDLLVNNAGVQRRVGLATDDAPWAVRQREIDLLFAAPVHLNSLLVPRMLAHGCPSTVVNVTSGGAFVPQPFAPVYSASKAALHSYTLTLRLALAGSTCRVVELVPPAVATTLAGGGHGAPLDDFCDAVFPLLDGAHDEVGYGATAGDQIVSFREAGRALFDTLSERFPVPDYRSVVEPPQHA